MSTAEAALARLCDPAAKVSSHYLIDETGQVVALVEEKFRAWHAGRSAWQGRGGLNDVSIGIELVNPGHGHGLRPFPACQIAALGELALDIERRYGLRRSRVVGHSDIAPDRKLDPGERFPWAELAAMGIGLWPDSPANVAPVDLEAAGRNLRQIGYAIDAMSGNGFLALAAFQRRFRPGRVDGRLDAETATLIHLVARLTADERAPPSRTHPPRT